MPPEQKAIPKKGDKKNNQKLVGIILDSDYLKKEKELKKYLGCTSSADLYRRFLTEEYRRIFEEKREAS